MKVFVLFAALVALVAADPWDPAKMVPIYDLPAWQETHPEMTTIFKAQAAEGRIISGSAASAGQFPHQVVVNVWAETSGGLCGGSLVHPNWVLTAAHCIDITGITVVIQLGAINRLNTDEAGQVLTIGSSSVIHPNWNPNISINDVGVVQIPTVTLTARIQVIGLAADQGNTFVGATATVSGWGWTTDYEPSSDVLIFVNTQVITNADCAAVYGSTSIISSTICTIGGTCNGDSGGPLINDGIQIGVVSFGAAESCANFPSAFARVSHFRDWISSATSGAV